MIRRQTILALLLLSARFVTADEPPLSPSVRRLPGETATPWLTYVNPGARKVEVSGSWNQWTNAFALQPSNAVWVIDVRNLPAGPGRQEFKFIVDGKWESGDNRSLYLNDDRLLEKPPDIVISATLDAPDEITLYLRQGITNQSGLTMQLVPEVPIKKIELANASVDSVLRGYAWAGGVITFVMDEKTYNVDLPPNARVAVAGNFNGWDASGGPQGQWLLHDGNNDGTWELTTPFTGLRPPAGEEKLMFKFVVDGARWLPPPGGAVNAMSDGKGNNNLRIDSGTSGSTMLKVITENPLNVSSNYTLIIDGLADRRIRQLVSCGKVLDSFISNKELGAILDQEQQATTYRLFAPRASRVQLCLFDTPEHEKQKPQYTTLEPAERYDLWKDETDGVWEVSLLGLDTGKYYAFAVDGPSGDGEGFNAKAYLGDPYARAAAHAHNNTIVIDPTVTNEWFAGWSDGDFRAPSQKDMIIYETHIRDFTMHPSSKVPPQLKGTYEGFAATVGTGNGLDHLRNMGVNMVEIMPVGEFENGTSDYNWGYNTVYFFAPEASYGRAPLKGAQYYEMKNLVNEIHRQGLGVILDVVYNHVGGPNIFSLIDRKYFFRLTPDYAFLNFSGVGNDTRSEAPMMRRFIVDNILYWMREHHVDGFRFDLAELVDKDTRQAIRDAALQLNTNVILIAEPWSGRGENKRELKGTGWAAWNNDFRYADKDFARGHVDRDWLRKVIMGSTEIWSANPLQSINYLESHDDMALADDFCLRPDHNGKNLQDYDVAMNRLAATVQFLSLGIPMLAEGQEFLRSKYGLGNTYNRGDGVNALDWTDRDRPLAAEAMAYYRGLIALRQSAAGSSFRVAQVPPQDYFRWIMPAENKAIGFIVNSPRIHEGNGFIVLANASDSVVPFQVNMPEGRWRVIGDGVKIDPTGLPGTSVQDGPGQATIQVPPMRALILMDGF